MTRDYMHATESVSLPSSASIDHSGPFEHPARDPTPVENEQDTNYIAAHGIENS